MHSSLSLAVGYNRVVTHGRRSCNNVVATLAKDKTPSLQRSSRCRAPTSILPLAALLFSASCGAASALRPLRVARGLLWCDHDYPGGAGTTLRDACQGLPRARRTGFYHRVGAPTGPPLGAPTLRFAPSRFPKPSLTLAPAVLAHNTLRYGHPPSGAPGLSGAGLCGVPCGVPALYSTISLEAPAGSGSPILPRPGFSLCIAWACVGEPCT